MKYRKFGKLDWNASVLGFGCMRLPTVDKNPTGPNIDVEKAIDMLRYAIDQGVNYVDTAYFYHGGKSEVLVGKALKDGYREKVRLATKSPLALIKQEGDFDRFLDEQLERLQTDKIDFYLLHNINKRVWNEAVLKFNLFDKLEKAVRDGKIVNVGFSFHDDFDLFKTVTDSYDKWDFCQIQYNYMDIENQAGTRGLKYAAEKGLAVVIMEPLLGGKLAVPPKDVRAIFDEYDNTRTPVEFALQWVWNHPEVTVVLSGMSNIEQVRQNISSANNSGVNSLTAKEMQLIDRVRKKYNERAAIPCSKCSYCMPCPNGVNIPGVFDIYNQAVAYENVPLAVHTYNIFIPSEAKAGNCIKCGNCEEKCPQQIAISQWMPKVAEMLERS